MAFHEPQELPELVRFCVPMKGLDIEPCTGRSVDENVVTARDALQFETERLGETDEVVESHIRQVPLTKAPE